MFYVYFSDLGECRLDGFQKILLGYVRTERPGAHLNASWSFSNLSMHVRS